MSNFTYLSDNFIPVQTKNIVKEFWGFGEEADFTSKVLELENACIGLVQSQINLKILLNQPRGEDVMRNLCSLYVGAKLFEQISNTDYESYVAHLDNAFWNVVNAQKEVQEKLAISSDDEQILQVSAGMEVF